MKQVDRNINNLKLEDHAFSKFGFNDVKMPSPALRMFGMHRGFNEKDPQEIQEFFTENWLPRTNSIDISNSMYLWHAVINYDVELKNQEML